MSDHPSRSEIADSVQSLANASVTRESAAIEKPTTLPHRETALARLRKETGPVPGLGRAFAALAGLAHAPGGRVTSSFRHTPGRNCTADDQRSKAPWICARHWDAVLQKCRFNLEKSVEIVSVTIGKNRNICVLLRSLAGFLQDQAAEVTR